MDNPLIFLGILPTASCLYKNDTTPNQLVLELLGNTLEAPSFSKKAAIASKGKWEELFVSINETVTTSSIKRREKYGNGLAKTSEKLELAQLTLDEIKKLPKFNRGLILTDTVSTHNCNIEMACPICKGSGECQDCNGKRHVACDVCNGSTDCPDCNGSGRFECSWCEGSGDCDECNGSGRCTCDDCDGTGTWWRDVECRDCDGTGDYRLRNGELVTCLTCNGSGIHHTKYVTCNNCGGSGSLSCDKCGGDGLCAKCGGAGNVECRACHGSGVCGKCKGKGIIKCYSCHASGRCARCAGTGRIVCTRCHGTGFYQTFDVISLSSAEKRMILRDKRSEVITALEKIKKTVLYDGSPYIIEFSKGKIDDSALFEVLSKQGSRIYHSKMNDYKNRYFSQDSASPITAVDTCIQSHVIVESVPVLKYKIDFSKKTFTFYVLGEEQAVFCDKKPNWLDKLKARFFQ